MSKRDVKAETAPVAGSRRLQILAAVAGAVALAAMALWLWPRADNGTEAADERMLVQVQRAKSRIDALMAAGKTDQAAEEYRALLAGYPDAPNTVHLHGLLAGLLLKLERGDEAIEVMEKLVRRKPDSLDAGTKLVALYTHLGRIDDAVGQLKRLTDAFPKDATAPAALGLLLAREKKDPVEGERYFRVAYKRSPRNGSIAGQLAEVLAVNRKTAEAIVLYREAIRGSARRDQYRLELARLLFEKFAIEVDGGGEPYLREAIAHLQAVLRERRKFLGPRAKQGDDVLVTCCARIAEMHAQLKEYGPAVGYLQWAIQYSRKPNSFLWMNLIRYALASGDQNELKKAIAAVHRQWPNDPKMAFSLGMLYADAGRKADAIRELKAAVKADPDFASAHYQLAEMSMREKNLADANEHIFEALRIAPLNPMYKRLKDTIVKLIHNRSDFVDPDLPDDDDEDGDKDDDPLRKILP